MKLQTWAWMTLALAAILFSTASAQTPADKPEATPPATAPATAPAKLILYPGMTRSTLEKIPYSGDADTSDKQTGPRAPLLFPDLTIGFHLNADHYPQDTPITAYFVLKNAMPLTRGVELRPEYFRDLSRLPRSVKIEIHRTDHGAIALKGRGSVPRIVEELQFCVPAKGLCCFSGDLRTLGEDNTLPVGAYAASWTYAGVKSREMAFSVTPGAAHPPAAADGEVSATMPTELAVLPDRVDLIDLVGTSTKRKRGDPTLDWTNPMLNRESGTMMGCGIACGIDGRYYPDLYDLPTHDEFFNLSAEYTPGLKAAPANNDDTDPRKDKTLDHILVKIAPIAPADASYPRLLLGSENTSICLLVEAAGRTRVNNNGGLDNEGMPELATESWSLEKGGTINIVLPKGWKGASSMTGRARVAVLLVSEWPSLPFQQDGQEMTPMPVKSSRYWRGVLRTNYMAMDMKK